MPTTFFSRTSHRIFSLSKASHLLHSEKRTFFAEEGERGGRNTIGGGEEERREKDTPKTDRWLRVIVSPQNRWSTVAPRSSRLTTQWGQRGKDPLGHRLVKKGKSHVFLTVSVTTFWHARKKKTKPLSAHTTHTDGG